MSLITKISPIEKTDNIGTLTSKELNLHDCLTDDADWNNKYWDFYPECINIFTDTLKSAYKLSTKGIKFQAIWAGDKPKLTIVVTINEMVNILRTNKVNTHALYILTKNNK